MKDLNHVMRELKILEHNIDANNIAFKFNHYINVTSQFAVKVKYNLDKNK